MPQVSIIECPRDAMQGLKAFIPTEKKIEYLNSLLKVGFHVLDCGSFVSSKAIPQMADTYKVIPKLDLEGTDTKLSVIVANGKGADLACEYDEISYLGYPFSVSETFQLRNTNCNLEESVNRVEEIMNTCEVYGKKFVLYLSMAFGNPYGDMYHPEIVAHWVDRLSSVGVERFSVSDTVGIAQPQLIKDLLSILYSDFTDLKFGAHFHTTPDKWQEKVEAAYEVGCVRFDGAIKGYGGCPMAKDDLTGNMPTEKMIEYFESKGISTGLDLEEFANAMRISQTIFQ
ncbi:MAG: hydroxymethylglutaryl-CoA lyase [Chitinophagales bacterium]|nr:hydroxymethylglutaryl-CoA lyase [Chitinophagales bacterium]